MLQNAFQKFYGGCMMVVRQEGETVFFLGTAFLVHGEGYLLTVAHILPKEGRLMVVPNQQEGEFQPTVLEQVAPLPVHVARIDVERDLALLKLEHSLDISLPDHFLGTADSIAPGTSVMALGFSFGLQQIHSLVALNAIVCCKVISRNHSKLLLFDSMVHDGDRGGPLVNVEEGLVVGVINGRFNPVDASRDYTDGSQTLSVNTNISYAVAIDYASALFEAEGLTQS